MMTPTQRFVFCRLACLLTSILLYAGGGAAFAEPAIDPLDWFMWRGPAQNNTSPETGLPDSWNPRGGEGSNLLWQSEALAGRSTPIVMGGKIYTIVRHKPDTAEEAEKVVCADAAKGEILWEHRFNVYLTEVPNTRVGWSSVVGDPLTGRVYALGVCGYFCCLEGDTGEVVWSRSLQEEYGTISTYGGRTNFPLVFEDTVIISAVVVGWGDTPQWGIMSKPAHRFMGFDKATGELRWMGGTRLIPYDTTYSTPTITVIDGRAQMIFGSGDGGIWSLEPRTGRQIWSYGLSHHGINTPPLVVGNMVYAGHSEENSVGSTMGAIVALDASQLTARQGGAPSPKEVWKKYEVMNGRAGPIMVENQLWVVEDGAKLLVFDPKTGEQVSRKALGTMQRSTPLFADGKVYITEANGSAWILRPNGSQVETVHRLRLGRQSCDASPIVSHGKIYISTSQFLYCIGNEAVASSEATPVAPEIEAEPPVEENAAPAHVQVVPFDTLLHPGQSQAYRVRLYNDRGQFIREAAADEVQFSVLGPGDISADGTYSAPEESGHEAILVTCGVAGVEGKAKVRVIPPLPWKWDFNQLADVPLTWIGGRVRYVLREVDGEKVMVKVDTIPTRPGQPDTKLGTRSYLSMGPPDLSNYTIQADVQLTEKDGKLPDAGLINSRYMMTFMGEGQRVIIDSWSSHDYRHQAILPMPLEAGKWYSVKFSVVPGDGQAVARGKVWPKGEAEPEQWTLEMIDSVPNLEGTPGLFGNTGNSEFFIDNISVTSNDS